MIFNTVEFGPRVEDYMGDVEVTTDDEKGIIHLRIRGRKGANAGANLGEVHITQEQFEIVSAYLIPKQ